MMCGTVRKWGGVQVRANENAAAYVRMLQQHCVTVQARATLKPTAIQIRDCGDCAGIECVNLERIHDDNKPVTACCW